MIKQILGRLPRNKPSKSDGNDSVSEPLNNASNNGNERSNEWRGIENSRSANFSIEASINEPLPLFQNVERQSLFVKKVHLCSIVFDFTDPMKNVKEKDIKRQTLLELVDYIASGNGKFTETVMELITRMVAINLFRSFPPSSHDCTGLDTFDAEEEESIMEPAWSHLQIVYELLLRFIVSAENDAKLAKRYINHSFVLKLLNLFDSEDRRERIFEKCSSSHLREVYGALPLHPESYD